MRNFKGALLFTIGLLTVEGGFTFKKMQGLCDPDTRGEQITMMRDKDLDYCEKSCLALDSCHAFVLGNGDHMYDGTCELFYDTPTSADGNGGWECWVKEYKAPPMVTNSGGGSFVGTGVNKCVTYTHTY